MALKMLLLSGAAAAAAVAPPGALFNLSSFKLQLPVAAPGGGVQEISQPALESYTSAWFYTDAADGGMTFFTPLNGAHTSGSNYPRTELRQEPNFDLSPGYHQINVTMQVDAVTSTGAITIGQVHLDGLSGACSIFVELEWSGAGDIVAHLRDSACKGVKATVGHGYALGQRFSYSMTVQGADVTVSTDSGSTAYACVPTCPSPRPPSARGAPRMLIHRVPHPRSTCAGTRGLRCRRQCTSRPETTCRSAARVC